MSERNDKPAIRWGARLMLMLLVFAACELVLLAIVMKGAWLALLVPAAVCAFRALMLLGEIRHKLERGTGR